MRKLGLSGNILSTACCFLWPSGNPEAPLLILQMVAPWRYKGLIGVALAASILQPASALAGGSLQASIPFSSLNYGQPIGNLAPTSVGSSYNQSIYLGDGSGNYNISLATSWTLPSGLQLTFADGTPSIGGLLQNASSFNISGSAPAPANIIWCFRRSAPPIRR